MISSVTARFMRRHQAQQYEPQEAEATISASVPDGADETEQNRILGLAMTKARGVVLAALGLAPKPQEPAASPGAPSSPTAEATTSSSAPAELKRGPGRPKKDQPAPGVADATPSSDTPSTAAPVDPASMEGVEEKPKAKTEAELLAELDGTAAEGEKELPPVSEQELTRACGAAAQALGSADPIKALMKNKYKIARIGEVGQKERRPFLADLDDLVKQHKAKKAA